MTGRRWPGVVLFVLGVVLAGGSVVLGRFFMPEFQGATRLDALVGGPAGLKLTLFGFTFPAGLGLSLVGAARLGGAGRGWVVLLLAPVGAVLVMAFIPDLFGRAPSPAFFGVGGVSILVLFVAVMWQWGRRRRTLDGARQVGADLQAAGYLCFAAAAWNLCGAAGMPGFAADPGRMIAAGSHAFVVGQLKIVMGFFVLGWLFTWLGLRRST